MNNLKEILDWNPIYRLLFTNSSTELAAFVLELLQFRENANTFETELSTTFDEWNQPLAIGSVVYAIRKLSEPILLCRTNIICHWVNLWSKQWVIHWEATEQCTADTPTLNYPEVIGNRRGLAKSVMEVWGYIWVLEWDYRSSVLGEHFGDTNKTLKVSKLSTNRAFWP